MENASKALIIAGAILLSILIIALGVFIFNQSKSAMGNIGLSDQEVSAFNSKWESYEGTQLGSSVRSLVTQVNNYNRTANDKRYISISSSKSEKDVEFADSNPSTGTSDLYKTTNYNAGNTYNISFGYTSGGLIAYIYISDK